MQTDSTKPRVHVGVFDRIAAADLAVQELVDAGIPKERITVICPTCTKEKYDEFKKEEPSGSHAASSAARGGAIGAVLGGLAAAVGIAASGGVGLLAAGPLLAGSGGGALFGGFVGAMMTRGLEREVADFYDQALEKGQILVAVEVSDEVTQAHLAAADRIFVTAGAEQLTLKKT